MGAPKFNDWAGTPFGWGWDRANQQTCGLGELGLVLMYRYIEGSKTKWGQMKVALNYMNMPNYLKVFTNANLPDRLNKEGSSLITNMKKHLAAKKTCSIAPKEDTGKIWGVCEHEFTMDGKRHRTRLILSIGYFHMRDASDEAKMRMKLDDLQFELRYKTTVHKANVKLNQLNLRYDGYAYKAPLPHVVRMLTDPKYKAGLLKMSEYVSIRIVNSADVKGIQAIKGENVATLKCEFADASSGADSDTDSEEESEIAVGSKKNLKRKKPEAGAAGAAKSVM